MTMSGYSSTPLLRKLGIKPGTRLYAVDPPANYRDLLGPDNQVTFCKAADKADMIHLFCRSFNAFCKSMESIRPYYEKNSAIVIWVSWYKKSSKQSTDITEEDIRQYALRGSLVDIKVCAIDDDWSGLKLVVRLKHR